MPFAVENNVLVQYRDEPGVTEFRIPDGVQEIADLAFSFCEQLRSVWMPDSVQKIGKYAFQYCTGLTTVRLPEGLARLNTGVFYKCTALQGLTFPDSLKEIGGYACFHCFSLRSVTFPEGLESIAEEAFCRCSLLEEVTLPDSIRFVGDYAFSCCPGLTAVTIPGGLRSVGSNPWLHTPWFDKHPDDVVVVGDHIVLAAHGREEIVRIPDDVKEFSDGFTLDLLHTGYPVEMHGIIFHRAIWEDVYTQTVLVEQKRYDELKMYGFEKYPLLWQVFCQRPEEPEITAFVREHLDPMLRLAIRDGLTRVVEAVCENGTLLTPENIDRFLDRAFQAEQPEIRVLLLNEKNKLGFGPPSGPGL